MRKHLRVLRKISRLFLILALLATVGGHWFVFQSVAWATMLVDNLQTGSLSEAVTRTFGGDHPCRMCKQITEQRKSEKQPDAPAPELRRLEFVLQPAVFTFTAPQLFWFQTDDAAHFNTRPSPPPLPPPRSLPA